MKMLVSDQVHPTEEPELDFSENACDVDPELGWTDEVAVKKSHFCLLLKPQIVLSSELDEASILIAVASSATFQTFGILDKEHIDDPVNGPIMNRSVELDSCLQSTLNVFQELRVLACSTGIRPRSTQAFQWTLDPRQCSLGNVYRLPVRVPRVRQGCAFNRQHHAI